MDNPLEQAGAPAADKRDLSTGESIPAKKDLSPEDKGKIDKLAEEVSQIAEIYRKSNLELERMMQDLRRQDKEQGADGPKWLKPKLEGMSADYEQNKEIIKAMERIKEKIGQGDFQIKDGRVRIMLEPPVSNYVDDYMESLAKRTGHPEGHF